jgi:hypothetical protein
VASFSFYRSRERPRVHERERVGERKRERGIEEREK